MLFFLPSETVALNMMDTRNKSGQVTGEYDVDVIR